MSPGDYQFLARFLLARSGLALGDDKHYLLEGRLLPIAQSRGLADLSELVAALRAGTDKLLIEAVTEAMTTNETFFFRDKAPFEDFTEFILPRLLEARSVSRTLNFWCAAASTGQEPYSIAISLLESFPEVAKWDVNILATDISAGALKRAQAGVYSQFEIQRGLPIRLLIKYFEHHPNGWRIRNEVRPWITFRQLNLLEPIEVSGAFDLIFCRNVLIYFDLQTKKDTLQRLLRLIRPDGYICLGSAETLLGITDAFERFRVCRSAYYAPLPAPRT